MFTCDPTLRGQSLRETFFPPECSAPLLKPVQTGNVWRPNTINIVWWPNILPFGHLVWCCLVVFEKVWRPSNIRPNNLKHFFCSCVWWVMFCSFGQPRIKHVWRAHASHACSVACAIFVTFWPLTSIAACLVTKQRLMMFGRQKFTVWTGLYTRNVDLAFGLFNCRLYLPPAPL